MTGHRTPACTSTTPRSIQQPCLPAFDPLTRIDPSLNAFNLDSMNRSSLEEFSMEAESAGRQSFSAVFA